VSAAAYLEIYRRARDGVRPGNQAVAE
jgi:hypothetical protein